MTFSPVDAAMEGFRVTKRAPLAVLAWAAVYFVMMAAMFALAAGPILHFISVTQALDATADPTPEQAMALVSSMFGGFLLIIPVALAGGAMLATAAARAVLRPQDKAFGYLRLGKDELRVLVVMIAITAIFMAASFVVSFVAGILMVLIMGGAAAGGDASAGVAAGVGVQMLMWLLFLPLMAWLGVKLSLAVPITVAERKIAIVDSWNLTKGRFWPLLGMAILAGLMAMVVNFLAQMVLLPVFFLVGGPAIFPLLEQMESTGVFDGAALMAALGPTVLICGVLLALIYALQMAIMYAPFSRAYLQIKGVTEAATPQDQTGA